MSRYNIFIWQAFSLKQDLLCVHYSPPQKKIFQRCIKDLSIQSLESAFSKNGAGTPFLQSFSYISIINLYISIKSHKTLKFLEIILAINTSSSYISCIIPEQSSFSADGDTSTARRISSARCFLPSSAFT